MMLLVVLLASILLALLRGGKLGNFAQLKIRWSWLILIGFLIQLIVFQPFWQDRSETQALTQVAYMVSLILLLFALLANLRVPGVALLALGFALNFIAIALNGGYMPASPEAVALAGRSPRAPGQVINNSIGA
ncbi:MAG: DUF5317 family protein, partial [Chloroflexi bacterium]|nr:DUF5317 family protein [Chloroflexota bacterium]